MKEKFQHTSIVIIVILLALVAAGCQSGRADSINLLLQSDNPTMVSFPLMAASQIYDFSADAQLPMQISLVPITRDLAYTAELRDERGSVMATVRSSAIQNAVLTVEPGSQHYQVAIISDNATLQGILSVQVSRTNASNNTPAIQAAMQSPMVVTYQSVALTIPNSNAPCSASSGSGVSVNLRSGPGMEFSIVGTLVYGTALSVSGQSNNGWYQVIENGQLVWVSSSVAALGGNCANLPDVTPATVTGSNSTLQLVIAETGWGSLYENIAALDVNPNDLITISAPTLTATQRYEEFTLTLLCSGNGADGLRWGAAEKPTLMCGSSVVVPLTDSYRQQVIAVTLPHGNFADNVQYTLMASRRV